MAGEKFNAHHPNSARQHGLTQCYLFQVLPFTGRARCMHASGSPIWSLEAAADPTRSRPNPATNSRTCPRLRSHRSCASFIALSEQSSLKDPDIFIDELRAPNLPSQNAYATTAPHPHPITRQHPRPCRKHSPCARSVHSHSSSSAHERQS